MHVCVYLSYLTVWVTCLWHQCYSLSVYTLNCMFNCYSPNAWAWWNHCAYTQWILIVNFIILCVSCDYFSNLVSSAVEIMPLQPQKGTGSMCIFVTGYPSGSTCGTCSRILLLASVHQHHIQSQAACFKGRELPKFLHSIFKAGSLPNVSKFGSVPFSDDHVKCWQF